MLHNYLLRRIVREGDSAGLSPRTVHHMHRILFQALKQAVRWLLIVRNPADITKKDRPRVERMAPPILDASDTVDAHEDARARRLYIPMMLGSALAIKS